jgi:hypothetical protein
MKYYVLKLLRKISRIFYKSFAKGVYFRQGNVPPQCVYLDHTDINVVHLGDLLFFLDTIWMCQASKIPVILAGSNQMAEFFKLFGVAHQNTFTRPGIILTKDDSLLLLRPSVHTVVGFNFWKIPGVGPVSPIVKHQFQLFCAKYTRAWTLIQPNCHFFDYFKSNCVAHFAAFEDQPRCRIPLSSVVLINSYVSSNTIAWRFRCPQFNRFLNQFKAQYTVCVGSASDKQRALNFDPNQDLRGALSINELLAILAQGRISLVVSFDTFIAHLAVLFDIDLNVFVRSKFKITQTSQRFLPFFESKENRIKVY